MICLARPLSSDLRRTTYLNAARGCAIIFAAASLACGAATAQRTGTVASPVIKPGASIGFAVGLAAEEDEAGYAHRFDYKHALFDRWQVRAMAVYNDRGGDYRYRRLALEAMHQFASSEHGWNSAIQVRGRLPDGNDGPGRVRVAWLNRWRSKAGTELRLIGLASQEFGDERRNGLALETRAEASWPLAGGTRIGAQMFNRFNRTTDFGAFKTQQHSVGGALKGDLTETVSFRLNALTGLSESAPDFELRFRLQLKL